jgi:hypothetical protein
LKVAGASRLDLFSADAVAMIYRASEGIPRLVNNICDNALLTGYAMNARTITPEIVAEVAEALDLLHPMIEDDPRQVMESSLPALPVISEQAEADWTNGASDGAIADPAGRRRSSSQFKVIPAPDRGEGEGEEDIKAG